MTKGFAVIYILISLVVLVTSLVFTYAFLAQPFKVVGDRPLLPFRKEELMFGEGLSYLFREPSLGERVIFVPEGVEMDYVGMVTNIERQQEVTTYTVSVTGKGRPWVLTKDKIKKRIYYPFLNDQQALQQFLSAMPTPTPTPAAPVQPGPVGTYVDTGSNNQKVYQSRKYNFSVTLPSYLVLNLSSTANIITFLQKQDDLMAQRLLIEVVETNKTLTEWAEDEKYAVADAANLSVDGHEGLAFSKETSSKKECNFADTKTFQKYDVVIIKGSDFIVRLIPNDSCETLNKGWFAPVFSSINFN